MDEPAKRPGQSAIPPSKASGPPARRKYAIALRWGAAIALGIGILLYLTYSEMRAKRKLALIRGALQDYASSIKSLEGRYEIESGWNARDPDQLRSTGERPNSHSKSTAAFGVDFASKRWFRDYIRAEGEGTDPELWLRRRELAVFDGSLGSTLHYLPAYPGEEADDWPPPNFLMIDSGSHEMATPPWIFAGIKTNFVGGGLVRILETAAGEGKIKYKGTERIDGALCECVTIELPPDHVARFWFDPERDYLPRRQELNRDVVETFEFAQFRDEETQALRWFPVRGRHHWSVVGDSQLVVNELRINLPLDTKRFQIDVASLPDGVKIDDRQARKTSITGDRLDLWEDRQRENRERQERHRKRSQEAADTASRSTIMNAPTPAPREDTLAIYQAAFSRMWPWAIGLVSALAVYLIGVRIVRSRVRPEA